MLFVQSIFELSSCDVTVIPVRWMWQRRFRNEQAGHEDDEGSDFDYEKGIDDFEDSGAELKDGTDEVEVNSGQSKEVFYGMGRA